jgi:hypothetical protein
LKYERQSAASSLAAVEKVIAGLVYASVVLGVFFLAVIHGVPGFPSWLFYSIMGGEGAWIVCAVAIAKRVRWAPYLALVLALITLAISLPQPTHYTFAETGQIVAFFIFAAGSAIQVALIIAIAVWRISGSGVRGTR